MKNPVPVLFALLFFLTACSDESMMTAADILDDEEMENTSSRRTGTFEALNGKTTSGQAVLSALDEDTLQLMFSTDFSLTDGPGLFVYLSDAEFVTQSAINLGDFQSPTGAQNYNVPDGVSLDDYTYVIVHCVPYNVTFAIAELR